MQNLFLYGPPGSGKSTLGKLLAGRLDLPFLDLDRIVQNDAGMPVRQIFETEGEAGFRRREKEALEIASSRDRAVIALGGGSLLDAESRALVESRGIVVCLDCPLEILRSHIDMSPGTRPLVNNGIADSGVQLEKLMKARAEHYASFRRRLDVAGRSLDDLCEAAEILFGAYRIDSGDVPSNIAVGEKLLAGIGELALEHDLGVKAVVVGDANTSPLYVDGVVDSLRDVGIQAVRTSIPAGEGTKNLSSVQDIWRVFLNAGITRSDFVVAVGGGVVSDLTGFAAATWMRGIRWVDVPTSLLSMLDASTGGKTGCDLPGAKNMVGAFHSPSFVLADVETLLTLPAREWRAGFAEAIKHAIISDPGLVDMLPIFDGLAALKPDETFDSFDDFEGLAAFVSRALAVKVHVVRQDPLERGLRAKLNLGHTVGHAIEVESKFTVSHGEAVAIGTVEEARLAVRQGFASPGWPDQVAALFRSVGLPAELPAGMSFDSLRETMLRDKKRKGDAVRFALPCGMGDVCLADIVL